MTSEHYFIYNGGKESKFHAFIVYILVVYVNKNLNTQEKNIPSKTTYTLNRKHLI